jgi:hypothetical protein
MPDIEVDQRTLNELVNLIVRGTSKTELRTWFTRAIPKDNPDNVLIGDRLVDQVTYLLLSWAKPNGYMTELLNSMLEFPIGDNPALNEKLREILAVTPQGDKPLDTVVAGHTPGPMRRYRKEHYIERGKEGEIAKALADGESVTIYGPLAYGKTWIKNHIKEKMAGHFWIEPNVFAATLGNRESFNDFLRDLAIEIFQLICSSCEGLLSKPFESYRQQIEEIWAGSGNGQKKLEELLMVALADRSTELIVAMDNIDRLAPSSRQEAYLSQDVANGFMSMLNYWIEIIPEQVPHFLFSVAMTPRQLDKVIYPSSPFAHTYSVNLGELDEEDTQSLASLYGVRITMKDVERLRSWIGGHPYLLALAFDRIHSSGLSAQEIQSEWFVHHLTRIDRHLKPHPELQAAFRAVCSGNCRGISETCIDDLLQIGLIRLDDADGNRPTASYGLYRRRWSRS